jgi:hypothetical protein
LAGIFSVIVQVAADPIRASAPGSKSASATATLSRPSSFKTVSGNALLLLLVCGHADAADATHVSANHTIRATLRGRRVNAKLVAGSRAYLKRPA